MAKKFYIYRHIRQDKSEPFYIGKGTCSPNCTTDTVIYRRAFSTEGRNSIWKGITSRSPYYVEIIFETEDRELIDRKEIEFIEMYGRIDLGNGTLCNLTSGGDGQYEVSKEAQQRGINKRHENGSFKRVGLINSRPVFVYDQFGKFVDSFVSKRECARTYGIDVSEIFTAIKEKKMFRGFYYSNENNKNGIDVSGFRYVKMRNIKNNKKAA